MNNSKGIVTTLAVFATSIFGITLILSVITSIRTQYENSDYIIENVNNVVNNKINLIDAITKLK